MTLMLRTCRPDGTSKNGFRWPLTVGARVEAPDWSPVAECGNGLHGLIGGVGDGSLLDWSPDAVWLVWEPDGDVVDLVGKGKARSGVVLHVGDCKSATEYLIAHGCRGAIVGACVTSGYGGTSTSGYGGTSTSGDRGTSTSGDFGTSTSGYMGTSTSGDGGTLCIKWWDGVRYRIAVGYVGECGIKPHTPYRVNDRGEFVEVTK